MHKGVVSVEFETREGSAKIDKDFKYTAGSLVSEGHTQEANPKTFYKTFRI